MYTYYNKITSSSMRAGWTMIELILILVVIGILASIAIPRLAATRDDAKLSIEVSNMAICIRDIGSEYTATGVNLINIDSDACDKVVCFTREINASSMTVDLNVSGADYCADIQNVGGHLVQTYEFAGATVKR